MTNPETFRIPLAVASAERICIACKAGFYRPTGETTDKVIMGPGYVRDSNTKWSFIHKCPACGDQQNLEAIYPQIEYRPIYDLEWTDKAVRETWKKQHKVEN